MIDNRHTNSFKCKYHNSGYCKFGDHCRKRHYKQICQKFNCRNDCQARHPVLCKYGQNCKFSKKGICAYKHTTAINNLENKYKVFRSQNKDIKNSEQKEEKALFEEINKLKSEIKDLKRLLKDKVEVIDVLRKQNKEKDVMQESLKDLTEE